MTEEWRDIKSCPGYQASSSGRIRSTPRQIVRRNGRGMLIAGKVLSLFPAGDYLAFDAGGRNMYVARAVAEAFHGPRPEGLETCHNDGNSQNNNADNLRYDTHLANMADMRMHGTTPDRRGGRNPQAKLSESDVRRIRSARGRIRQADLAAEFGVSQQAVSMIQTRKKWLSAA